MRGAPQLGLDDHLEDQLTDLFGYSPATADSFSHFAGHRPVEFESSLMPPNDSFRQYEKEGLLPLRPEAAREHPKQLIERPQCWPRMLAFQDGELLPESEVF